jgi:hypothetical protein
MTVSLARHPEEPPQARGGFLAKPGENRWTGRED